MSGGTSGGNIITDAAATWAARVWVDVGKIDAYGPVADVDLATIIGANWFNQVDDALIQINAWLNGTGVAPEISVDFLAASDIEADTMLVGEISVDNNVLVSGTVSATAGMFGAGSFTDAASTADDVVVGNLGATDRGITILSTGTARVAFTDSAGVLAGVMAYTHSTNTFSWVVNASTELSLTSSVLAPGASNGLSLGSSSLRYLNAFLTEVTVYGTATVGDGTTGATLTLNRDTAQVGDIAFASEGSTQWRLRNDSGGDLLLQRFIAGVLQDTVTFAQSTSSVTLPGRMSLDSNEPVLTVGNGNGSSVSVNIDGAITYLNFQDGGTTMFSLNVDGDFNIGRYAGGVFQDAITLEQSTGTLTIPGAVVIGGINAAVPTMTLAKDTTGTASLAFYNEGFARWAFVFDSSENLLLQRYNASGVLQSSTTFTVSSGLWTVANDITMSGSGRTLLVGDNSGNASIGVSKTETGTADFSWYSAGVQRFRYLLNSSENMLVERYNSSGVLQDSMTITNSTGDWSFPQAIGLGGSASRLRQGSGVPGAGVGSNGDIYFRTDGTTATCIYFKSGGSWSALAT